MSSYWLSAAWLMPSEQRVGLAFQPHEPVTPGKEVAGLFPEDLLEPCGFSSP